MEGATTEHGPLVLFDIKESVLGHSGQLSPNPYAWNRNAHVVYVDQPRYVGFSCGTGKQQSSPELEISGDTIEKSDRVLPSRFPSRFHRSLRDFFHRRWPGYRPVHPGLEDNIPRACPPRVDHRRGVLRRTLHPSVGGRHLRSQPQSRERPFIKLGGIAIDLSATALY